MPGASTSLSPARRREIAELRLLAQGVVERPFTHPQQVAAHLGCLQGQHLGGVLAATAIRLNLDRTQTPPLQAVRDAFTSREIVRGYPMRGTVFLVAADDIAWMTELTRDRQLTGAAKRRAEHGFTDDSVAQAAELARDALAAAPDHSMTRTDLAEALGRGGIALDGGQRYHIIYTLIVRGDLVYGPLHGSDHHVVDAREWLPANGTLEARFNGDADAATGEWLRRYLVSHGPASLRDFHWWTKLPLGQIRRVATAVVPTLESYGVDGLGDELWGAAGLRDRRAGLARHVGKGVLLPAFDEVVLGYPDRELIVTAEHHPKLAPGNNGIFKPTAHRQGRVVGVWRDGGTKRAPKLTLDAFEDLPASATTEFAAAYAAYPRG